MWIVPKNLHTSHFALDTAALTSDYNALSELCAQSLLVRSSPTLARTWLRKWKQDSWTQHLFGRILKPSHGASFAEKWTSCQVASLVSPSAPLAPAEETRTPDTCSPTSSEDSESWADLPLFSSKMLKESLAPSSQETRGQTPKALPFCSMSSASWSEWVTRSRQEYSARLKWAQHTNASASLFLESAQTSETQGTVLSTRTWPTPNTSDSYGPNIPHDIGRSYLRTEVIDLKQWGTPRVALADSPRGRGDSNKDAYASRLENQVQMGARPSEHGPRDEEPNSTLGSLHESPQERHKGTLNPRWVETLMGLPVGWTMPSCACPVTPWLMSYASLETAWSPQQQSEPSESCGHSSTPLEDEEDEGY